MFITDFIDRVRLPFRKDKESYSCLYQIMGFYPRNIQYYKQALIHSSSAEKNDKNRYLSNNERLEFLGDAILDAVVGDIVFQRFKGKREGFLTNARSKIVQRDTLNKVAQEIGLLKLIKTSHQNNTHNSYMGGNAFEALVGAIYLDRGYDCCYEFMQKRILGKYINVDKLAYKEVNFKSKLIEWSQKNKVTCDFELIEQSTELSSPTFTSRVLIEGLEAGTGKGYSKKESQQEAAKAALAKLKKHPEFIDLIFQTKGKRTAMEENQAFCLSDESATTTLQTTDDRQQTTDNRQQTTQNPEPKTQNPELTTQNSSSEFDLSDISFKEKKQSREDIIAAAEAAAFSENA